MIVVKPFSEEYTQQVATLILDIQQNEFNVSITLKDQPDLLMIPSFYQNRKGNFWIALSGDEVVGTIALVAFNPLQAALRKMFVKKNYRGKEFGTAQKLFDTLLEWSKEKGIHEVCLGTISHMYAAQRFYERNGFDKISQTDLPYDFPLMKVDNVFYRLTLV